MKLYLSHLQFFTKKYLTPKMIKIIDTHISLHFWSEIHLLKIWYNKSSFFKHQEFKILIYANIFIICMMRGVTDKIIYTLL